LLVFDHLAGLARCPSQTGAILHLYHAAASGDQTAFLQYSGWVANWDAPRCFALIRQADRGVEKWLILGFSVKK